VELIIVMREAALIENRYLSSSLIGFPLTVWSIDSNAITRSTNSSSGLSSSTAIKNLDDERDKTLSLGIRHWYRLIGG